MAIGEICNRAVVIVQPYSTVLEAAQHRETRCLAPPDASGMAVHHLFRPRYVLLEEFRRMS
jgi:hypothetical protein